MLCVVMGISRMTINPKAHYYLNLSYFNGHIFRYSVKKHKFQKSNGHLFRY